MEQGYRNRKEETIDCMVSEFRNAIEQSGHMKDLTGKRLNVRIHTDKVSEGVRVTARSTDDQGRKWFSFGMIITDSAESMDE